MDDERLAEQRVQDLRQIRAHAGALARGEDDGDRRHGGKLADSVQFCAGQECTRSPRLIAREPRDGSAWEGWPRRGILRPARPHADASTPDSDLGFPAKGSLKRVPFPFLVRDIARTRTTGNLYLMVGETKKVVFFVDGVPTIVRSNLPAEFLGQILTDQGLITQEQCDNTLEAIRRTGKKQGELLVEMGILSEGNLRYGLDEQLRIKLFEIFGGRRAASSSRRAASRAWRPAGSASTDRSSR
jgi:hypothetical protein